jgi:hypothetical protein
VSPRLTQELQWLSFQLTDLVNQSGEGLPTLYIRFLPQRSLLAFFPRGGPQIAFQLEVEHLSVMLPEFRDLLDQFPKLMILNGKSPHDFIIIFSALQACF